MSASFQTKLCIKRGNSTITVEGQNRDVLLNLTVDMNVTVPTGYVMSLLGHKPDDFNFFFHQWRGTLSTAAPIGLLYQLQMIGDGDCGEIGGIKIGRGNRSTRRKPTQAPLRPPQIAHD
jgi:hypothetical protein